MTRTRTISLLTAAIMAAAIPALAQTACACQTGTTTVGILPIDAAVAQVTQTSPNFASTNPGGEAIQAGTPSAVTYHLAFLDRNGEQDFATPTVGSPNPQRLLSLEILRPDGTYIDQTNAITVPSTNGCGIQQVARTASTGVSASGGTPATTGGQAGMAWILTSWQDRVIHNGIVTCDFLANYNSGGATPVGVYTIRTSVLTGILGQPQVTTGGVLLQPVGIGPSQDVTTTVYNLQALTTHIGNANGTIDFGSVQPGAIALDLGGIKRTHGSDVVVTNQPASQPTNLVVTMRATDLYQNGTQTPAGTAPTPSSLPPITCDRVAVAMQRAPTASDAMTKSNPGGGTCDTKVFDQIPTMAPGQQIIFNAGMLDPGVGDHNFAFQAGQYLGVLKVCLTGPGGQGSPISIGTAPTNPVPSFNADLSQPVDAVGPIQSVA
ncbi:MAG: hypothetical protein ACYDBQ_01300 [Thermoplasmatota archaeon]